MIRGTTPPASPGHGRGHVLGNELVDLLGPSAVVAERGLNLRVVEFWQTSAQRLPVASIGDIAARGYPLARTAKRSRKRQ
jgi:hypothetical protein